jgi:hypothetical protein
MQKMLFTFTETLMAFEEVSGSRGDSVAMYFVVDDGS